MNSTKRSIGKLMFPITRILLGLLVLIPGIIKLFVSTPNGVIGMLTNLGFPIPVFFAWLLIFSEIIFGALVLFNWKLEYTVIPPVIILLVATFTAALGNYSSMLLHLVAVSSYLLIAYHRHH